MIKKSLKLRFFISCLLLLLTFIPFGTYGTDVGEKSFTFFYIWVGFILANYIVYIYAQIFFDCKFFHNILQKLQYYGSRILFGSNEKIFRISVLLIPIITSFVTGKLIWDNLPTIVDTFAQYTHSKLLANGEFSVPTHPFPEFFPMVHVITTGDRWYSQYQLGHLLPLALGHMLGIVYLINPIMCGISALLLYMISYDNYGVRIARITGLLTVFCTQWWYMASEYMNHNTTLLGILLFVWAWLRFLKDFKWEYGLVSGFGIGLALITRPITAFPIALPFALYGLYKLWKEPFKRWLKIIPSIAFFLLLIAGQLYFNLRTTGDLLVFGPEKLYGDQVKYGFGHLVTSDVFQNFYKGTAHTFLRGMGHLSNNLVGLNLFLFNWSVPSLIFVFIGMMVFRSSTITKLMFYSWVFLAVAYVPYFFQDWAFGVRYMYEITGFLIIFTAVGIVNIPTILRVVGLRMKRSEIVLRTNFLLALLFASGVILFSVGIPRYYTASHYNGLSALEIDSMFPDNSLVFVENYYEKLTIFMPPLDSNRVIYAKDLGINNQKLIDYYPNRKVFIETADGFKEIR